MNPFAAFLLGAAAGAAAVLYGPEIVRRARPAAKAAMAEGMTALHQARVKGAQMMEAAEDLFAEAKSEVETRIFGAPAPAQAVAPVAPVAAAAAAAAKPKPRPRKKAA